MSEPSTIPAPTQGRLTAAHRGYAYQDLLTAYLAVIALCDEYRAIVVDRKVVDDDRFDDLEVDSGSRRVRRQIKHSGSAQARLDFATFNAASSSLRFDRLVCTFVDQADDAADEYRLCATWRPPAAGDALLPLLESFDTPPTVSDTTARCYRLRADDVWPVDQPPKFACLLPTVGTAPVSRADVIRFCQRFVVELELPAASLDLDAPGTLERALLDALTARVGIGRYPNAERDAGDVAALAIHMAANARASGARLLPGEIARRLGVRTDFGRIAQAFPLDRAVLQPRVVQRERLRRAIESGGHHILLAGPGAGKSWALTQLAEDLADGGHVVARHYCFLDPGDELVERRVIADSFFGNLLGELNDALAGHGGLPPAGFAAGPVELERRLAEAAATGARIFLIIDGLDHIARVRAASVNLSEADTDIVEHLAALQLPAAVTLVLGSQPGDHLDPFRHAVGEALSRHEVTPWSATETLGLAQSHGLLAVFDDLQWHAPEARQAALDLLAERAEGNPLYARYLIRGLMTAMTKGHTVEPYEWLRDAPVIEGDIARYYRHLYTKASQDAKAVADLLGVLDFAVTARELTEITGSMLGEWVNEALGALAPILTQATAQGGIRIFHESFRRFMLTQLQDAGRQLSSVLNPAITWLESRAFFDDARSYRFLFVLLRRAGRDLEILQHVTNSFVEESLLGGHCEQAIEHNLWLACDTAARTVDWVALVRCGELLRSLASCFDDGANRWESYWHAFQSIHGPEAAAERLLFDGRPTLSRDEGLLVCASVDAARTVAPWREYLNLPVEDDTERQTFDPGDTGDALVHDETVWLATLRGRLRLGERFRMMRRVHSHLCLGDDTLSAAFVRRVGRLFAEELSPALVARMARRADPAQPTVFSIPEAYACALLLGAADFLRIGNDEQAQAFASAALGYATTPEQAMRCVERGASVSAARELAMDAAALMEGFEQRGILDAQLVRRWFASVRLNADADDPVGYFAAQRKKIVGPGWYPCWLRFALSVAEVEAARRAGTPVSCIPAFKELTVDTRPFVGSPRACDLFSIQKVINESLALGLSLLDTTQEWFAALSTVLGVRRDTATRMDREDGGPLPASDLVAILATFTDRDDARPPIEDALDTLIGEMEASGTYYSGHAELHLLAATMRAGGPVAAPRAIEHWQRAAPFMLGYGFHKDPTLFDVIESVPALADHEPAHAVTALEALQLSVGAVLRHTDGRSTKGAPNAWFRALLAVDPVLAIDTLIRSYAMDPGVPGWWVGVALTDAIGALAGNADPRLIDALWATVLFDVEYENQSGEMAEQRLLPLRTILSRASTEVCDRFIRLCAEVADDSRRHREGGLEVLQRFAAQYNLPWIVPPAASAPSNTPRLRNTRTTPPGPGRIARAPVFVPDARINELVVGIRSALNVVELDRDSVQALVLPLSYRLPDMLMRGEVTETHRLLYLLARETPS